MHFIKQHYQSISYDYDQKINHVVPHYDEMIGEIVRSIPFAPKERIKVLDIGAGTGNLSKLIKMKYPDSELICLDMTEEMIKAARIKLANFNHVTFEICDITQYDLPEGLDVIVSSLIFQNLATYEDLIEEYRDIYYALKSGGVFINAAIGLEEAEEGQRKTMEQWKDFMSKNLSEKEAQEIIIKYQQKDRPEKFSDEVEWLEAIGFVHAQVYWKKANFAVFGGQK